MGIALMGQQRLAIELRYRIDVARKMRTEDSYTRVGELLQLHPHALRSSHIRHNLGAERLAWLTRHRLG